MVVAASAAGNWVVSTRSVSDPAARLFCFPHAGGSYVAFSGWRERLPTDVEVISFCYPGRLRLIREAPLTDLRTLVAELDTAISGLLDVPFVFLGHSLGALVAFELSRHLRSKNGPQPAALILSGRAAPQLPRRLPDLHRLPPDELLVQLRALEGLPPELEQNEEFLSLILPTIRADLQMHETYAYDEQPPLDAAILALAGSSDPQATPPDVEAWKCQTTSAFSFRTFPGGHFFLFSVRDELLAMVGQALPEWLRGPGDGPCLARQD